MKKRVVLVVAAACAFSLLWGCGTKKNEQGSSGSDQGSNTEESSQAGQDEGDTENKDASGSGTQASYDASEYVELGEYMGLKLTVGTYEVTDEDVKSQIESMLSAYPTYEDLDKDTVEEGDFVNIDYEGLKDGVAFDGGTAQGAVLEIGSNSFIEGFEEGLVGKKVGEKVDLDLTFPEGYQNAELAGQAVVFHVTINKIVEQLGMTYEGMDDAYVAANFASQGYTTVEEFKDGIRSQMETNNESTKKNDIQSAIFEELAKVCKVKSLPDGLLQQKIDEYMEQFKSNLQASYGMELDEYLESISSNEEEFNTQVEEYMQETLQNQLILEAIAQKEKIEADEEGFTEYKKSVVSDFGYESEDALVEQYGEDYVKNVYVNNKTLEMLEENADITYSADAKEGEDSQAEPETEENE
ncbi:trigger factor [Lachnospiraceae bacterium 29-84]